MRFELATKRLGLTTQRARSPPAREPLRDAIRMVHVAAAQLHELVAVSELAQANNAAAAITDIPATALEGEIGAGQLLQNPQRPL